MSHGIKVVKPKTSITTDVASNVVLDSRAEGAMKIFKKIIIEERPPYLTSTFVNGAGVIQGLFNYNHKLGYAPAFLMFETVVENGQVTQSKILPDTGVFGAGYINALSTPQEITVSNLRGDSGENNTRYFLTLYIFAEDLDANV